MTTNTDKLAEEMDRRIDSLGIPPELPPELRQALTVLKQWCHRNETSQTFRHSQVYLVASNTALVTWD